MRKVESRNQEVERIENPQGHIGEMLVIEPRVFGRIGNGIIL